MFSHTPRRRMQLVDMVQIVRETLAEVTDSEQKERYDFVNMVVDWDWLRTVYGPTIYTKKSQPKIPNSNILYKASFSNHTPEDRMYNLKTRRRTTSVCKMCYTRALTFGGDINITATPPGIPAGVTTGFKAGKEIKKGNVVTSEQELTWIVNSDISVKPNHMITAEVKILEEEFAGDFELTVWFEGLVIAYPRRKQKDKIEKFQEKVAKNFLPKSYLEKYKEDGTTIALTAANMFTPARGFTLDRNDRPGFTIKGSTKCKFGLEQVVTLEELPAPTPTPHTNPFQSK
ncbi:uncharacterized protein LOC131940583 [Physella acuta]|uniref:uncharacterized protein LOC131940583 n=1 Tax=Physella acuta TaxID=109671 RepID=UPI0027DE6FE8|nr:uncharacterized protein LOC131940583 [Physella acuta]XP_059155266.1 uncharacterized protein LOC131940583 [Physella acuta]